MRELPFPVVDAHRLLGPLMTDATGEEEYDGVRARLDRLGVAACAASATWQVFGDPTRGPDGEPVPPVLPDAPAWCWPVPVLIPGPGGTRGWAAAPGLASGTGPWEALGVTPPAMVRVCPARHRWEVTSAAARVAWGVLADAGTPIVMDIDEVGFASVAAVARMEPRLSLLAVGAGYRELRRCAALLAEHPGVVLETGTLMAAGAVEWLARESGAHRLVFGTGAPLRDDAGPILQLAHLDLSEEDTAEIAAGTLLALTRRRLPADLLR